MDRKENTTITYANFYDVIINHNRDEPKIQRNDNVGMFRDKNSLP